MTTPEKNWVYWSDRESRESGKISLLAIAETIAAVAFYWWLALQIDVFFMLITSPIVAFLVLLRSDKSIKEGVRLFNNYLVADEPPTAGKIVFITVAIFCIAGTASYVLAIWYLIDHTVWSLFWRAGLLGFLALMLGFAGMVALAGLGALEEGVTLNGLVAVAVAGAVAVAVAGAGAGGERERLSVRASFLA